jgi:molybdopterin converting factor subunit 1
MSSLTVHFFASLREVLGTPQVSISCSDPLTLDELVAIIVAEHPDWQSALTAADVLVAVNQTMVGRDHTVQPGDEVAFFPPGAGG